VYQCDLYVTCYQVHAADGSAVHVLQLTVRDALNSALDEEMSRDPAVYILGEEVSQ
jgi:pyruvate dehydrogenase E1 component beta subunit